MMLARAVLASVTLALVTAPGGSEPAKVFCTLNPTEKPKKMMCTAMLISASPDRHELLPSCW